MTATNDWRRRFTAPRMRFPRWSAARPDLLAFVSTASGSWQAWTADLSTGERRQRSFDPIGVEAVLIAPQGDALVWWHDATGDERGHWVRAPLDGGDPERLFPDVPDGWDMGIAMVAGATAVAIASDDDYAIYAAHGDGDPVSLYRHEQPAGVGREWPEGEGGLSSDGTLLCIRHCEHGDILHPALRVLDARTGEAVAGLEHRGRLLDPVAWSPRPGDQRLLVHHELGEYERPGIWDVSAGELRRLPVDLPGAAFPLGWWPDANAILLRHEHHGREQLFRFDVDDASVEPCGPERGEILDAAVRAEGDVWLLAGDSATPNRLLGDGDREILSSSPDRPPSGRPFRSYWFENPAGDQIQAFVVEPPGDGPHPIVMYAHGGPEWHVRDGFDAEFQAFVDHGYALGIVNYRGSTGYGIAFREKLIRNVGFPESEDIIACLDSLVADGVADPGRVYFAGWSWGGYLACLNVGLNPDRWRAVFAGIPTGDYVEAHDRSSPPLQAWDVAMFGGHPADVPDRYRERDPMTFVSLGRAPTLIIAGRNDSRCPLSSATKWADAYAAAGGQVEVDVYDAGHHANDTAQQLRHMERVLAFFADHA